MEKPNGSGKALVRTFTIIFGILGLFALIVVLSTL